MEFGAVYTFTSPDQFWAELEDHLAISPDSSLDELDYALRNYVAFLSAYMDEYLTSPGSLDHALHALLTSPLFQSHRDRMTLLIIKHITLTSTPATLFIALMLILHLGLSHPLEAPSTHHLIHAAPPSTTSPKVFKAMRKQWTAVVPVLLRSVESGGVVDRQRDQHSLDPASGGEGMMPDDGWEERVGTAAAAVLYEVCRVQRLNADELALFTEPFISNLFTLVEATRNAADETFNYTLIKLLIALNEQFMVQSLPSSSSSGGGNLPPPILPKIVGERTKMKDPNLVLEVLKTREGDSKTFGENIIFILNRSNGSPDSLCVSLLILKILYLLFTTSDTHEYFYTNDLCVLVDVFIRELCDLGHESEGLKHTYLRVLHPLLTNTQLRHHPYKRPQLRRVLLSLVTTSAYFSVDQTTKRLVERCLRGSWCDGLTDASVGEGEHRNNVFRKGSGTGEVGGMGVGWSTGMGGRRDDPPSRSSSGGGSTVTSPRFVGGDALTSFQSSTSTNGSTLSLDAINAVDESILPKGKSAGARHRKIPSLVESPPSTSNTLPSVTEYLAAPTPLPALSTTLLSPTATRPRSSSLLSPSPVLSHSTLLPPSPPRPSSTGAHSPNSHSGRRRAPPPPPTSTGVHSRPHTPSGRRAAPSPPARSQGADLDLDLGRLAVS